MAGLACFVAAGLAYSAVAVAEAGFACFAAEDFAVAGLAYFVVAVEEAGLAVLAAAGFV